MNKWTYEDDGNGQVSWGIEVNDDYDIYITYADGWYIWQLASVHDETIMSIDVYDGDDRYFESSQSALKDLVDYILDDYSIGIAEHELEELPPIPSVAGRGGFVTNSDPMMSWAMGMDFPIL